MGIAGAMSYAFFEKRFGVRKTGLIGLIWQQFFMICAAVSIWLPGTPFHPSQYFHNTSFHDWWNELRHAFDGGNLTYVPGHVDWKHFTIDGVSMCSIAVFLISIAAGRYGN